MSDRKRAFPFRSRQSVDYKDELSDVDDNIKLQPKKTKAKDSEYCKVTGEDDSESSNSSDNENNSDACDEDSKGSARVAVAPWEDPKLSEYERMILKNIEARNQFMREMGFPEAVRDLKACFTTKAPEKRVNKARAKNKKKDVSPRPPPREPSRRIRKLVAKKEEEVKKEVEDEVKEEENAELADDRLLDSADMSEGLILNSILNNLSDAEYNPNLNLAECSIDDYRNQLLSLQMVRASKVTPGRTSSLLVHPLTSKTILFAGDKFGNFGVWIPSEGEGEPQNMPIHRAPLNCMSVSRENHSTIYTTGHDGAVVQVDFSTGKFTNVFATDWFDRVRHLTWHDEFENHKLLIAHGRGDVGILDVRASKVIQTWIECFPKSVRTVQHHPIQENYFVASSSSGSFKIFDLRNSAQSLCYEEHPKGLSSAFFSPGGTRIVTTCNDDHVRVFDSSSMSSNLEVTADYLHNNFTGRWLTPFRANWVPQRDDVFHVGSLLQPRRMQFYKADNGGILFDAVHEDMTTICSTISLHPTLPLFAGANSSGKVHMFGPSSQ